MKHKELTWFVFYTNINTGKIETFNALRGDIISRIKRDYKKGLVPTFDKLKEILKAELMYYYWSKCEYEYLVYDLFDDLTDPNKGEKKDVWFQLQMNLTRIAEYIERELKLELKH